jgi:hypothetical protein
LYAARDVDVSEGNERSLNGGKSIARNLVGLLHSARLLASEISIDQQNNQTNKLNPGSWLFQKLLKCLGWFCAE